MNTIITSHDETDNSAVMAIFHIANIGNNI